MLLRDELKTLTLTFKHPSTVKCFQETICALCWNTPWKRIFILTPCGWNGASQVMFRCPVWLVWGFRTGCLEAQPWGHCFGIVLERKRLEFQIEKLLNFTDYSLLVFLCAGFQRNNKHRKQAQKTNKWDGFRWKFKEWTKEWLYMFLFLFRVTRGWAAVSPASLCPPQWSPSPHPVCLTRVWSTPPTITVPDDYLGSSCSAVISIILEEPIWLK